MDWANTSARLNDNIIFVISCVLYLRFNTMVIWGKYSFPGVWWAEHSRRLPKLCPVTACHQTDWRPLWRYTLQSSTRKQEYQIGRGQPKFFRRCETRIHKPSQPYGAHVCLLCTGVGTLLLRKAKCTGDTTSRPGSPSCFTICTGVPDNATRLYCYSWENHIEIPTPNVFHGQHCWAKFHPAREYKV